MEGRNLDLDFRWAADRVADLPEIVKEIASLKPDAWRVLRTVGVEYIALVFLVDFLRNPVSGGRLHVLAYAPFVALGILGIVLRVTALVRRARRYGRAPISPAAPPAN